MSIYYQKYLLLFGKSFIQFIKSTILSSTLTLFVVTTIVSITELQDISRLFLLKITLIPVIPEILTGWMNTMY